MKNNIRTRQLGQHVSAPCFKVGFSHLMCIASFSISCSLLAAQSTMEKQFLLAKHRHAWDCCKWGITRRIGQKTLRAPRFYSIDGMSMTLSVHLRGNGMLFPFPITSIPNTLTYGLLWKRKQTISQLSWMSCDQ